MILTYHVSNIKLFHLSRVTLVTARQTHTSVHILVQLPDFESTRRAILFPIVVKVFIDHVPTSHVGPIVLTQIVVREIAFDFSVEKINCVDTLSKVGNMRKEE